MPMAKISTQNLGNCPTTSIIGLSVSFSHTLACGERACEWRSAQRGRQKARDTERRREMRESVAGVEGADGARHSSAQTSRNEEMRRLLRSHTFFNFCIGGPFFVVSLFDGNPFCKSVDLQRIDIQGFEAISD